MIIYQKQNQKLYQILIKSKKRITLFAQQFKKKNLSLLTFHNNEKRLYNFKNIYHNRNKKLKEKIQNFNIKNKNLKSQFRVIKEMNLDDFDSNFNDLNHEGLSRRLFLNRYAIISLNESHYNRQLTFIIKVIFILNDKFNNKYANVNNFNDNDNNKKS